MGQDSVGLEQVPGYRGSASVWEGVPTLSTEQVPPTPCYGNAFKWKM